MSGGGIPRKRFWVWKREREPRLSPWLPFGFEEVGRGSDLKFLGWLGSGGWLWSEEEL